MRIVHVVRQYAPCNGGMEDVVRQIATRQAKRGHHVRVVTLNRSFSDAGGATLPAAERIDGVEVVRVPFIGSRRYPIAPAALAHARRGDVVHVHGVDFFYDSAPLLRLLRRPLFATTHGGFFHTAYAARLKRVYFATATRLAAHFYKRIFASSQQDFDRFRTISDKVTLVGTGVDTGRFVARADPAARHIVYFGRWAKNKELPRLIGWFARAFADRPEWRLTIAGRPGDVTPADLAECARAAGVADRVVTVADPDDTALEAIIATASVYACASSYEGFGIAAVEAAAAGLYLLLSDIPPFRDTLATVGGGELVDFEGNDGPSFLRGQHHDAPLVPDRGAALSRYSWDAIVDTIDEAYRAELAR